MRCWKKAPNLKCVAKTVPLPVRGVGTVCKVFFAVHEYVVLKSFKQDDCNRCGVYPLLVGACIWAFIGACEVAC